MPYKDDSDGPWGSGKKKNTNNDGNKSPWGGNSGNNGSGSGQGETGIPEIDQIVKKGQERLRVLMGGRGGSSGGNGSGKTNILEAISLLNQGKGLRKANIEHFLYQEKNYDNASKNWGVNVDFVGPNGKFNIGTGLKKTGSNKSRIAKVNSDYTSLSSLGEILNISWITPQLCVLILSSMSEKRRFIDRLTMSIDSLHLNRVYRYDKLFRQRNKILMQPSSDKTWLDTIESQISELSISIIARRLDLLEELEHAARQLGLICPISQQVFEDPVETYQGLSLIHI